MRTHTQAFSLPKAGNSDDESQDRMFFDDRDSGYSEVSTQRFAIADGATESIYSRRWADLISRAWGHGQLDLTEPHDCLALLNEQWLATAHNSSVPWWAEQKIEQGSFATLIGLEIAASDGQLVWRTQAIGDSCIFVLTEDQVVHWGPIQTSLDFSVPPYLIGSNARYNDSLAQNVSYSSGTGGQEFLLMSDALACWYMRGLEAGRKPSELLTPLETGDPLQSFRELVLQSRDAGQMRNDDSTLISVQIIAR